MIGRMLSLIVARLALGIAFSLGAGCSARAPFSPAPPTPQEPARVFSSAAVAADHAAASRAGADILRAGGNAVDAAVATSFALSVVRPYSCGIGGGGFMLIRLVDHPRAPVSIALNYRERCPAAVGPAFFINDPDPDASTHGGKAVCVPGNVAGLLHALEHYGTLPRDQVLEPAIRLAEEGFLVDAHYVASVQEDVLPWFEKDPARRERFPFLWNRMLRQGQVAVGDRIQLPEQARALRLIAAHGAEAFYSGPIADAIVRAVSRDSGVLTHADLRAYAPLELEPLRMRFRERDILSMPLPSSGGIVVAQLAGMLERRSADLDALLPRGQNTPAYIHLVAEALQHAFADRARFLGEVSGVPVHALLSDAHLDDLASRIDPARTFAPDHYGMAAPAPIGGGTSHLCVVDARGNAVSCSETVNLIFGSFLFVEEFGFALNNEMDDFATRPGAPNAFKLVESAHNAPAPGKTPLSCMTPVIVTRAGRVELLAGASGGPRIITATAQATLNVLLFDLPAGQALDAPRFHHQWLPDVLQLEPALMDSPVPEALRALGHVPERRTMIGAVQLIRAVPGGPGWQAASDRRKGGAPDGY